MCDPLTDQVTACQLCGATPAEKRWTLRGEMWVCADVRACFDRWRNDDSRDVPFTIRLDEVRR